MLTPASKLEPIRYLLDTNILSNLIRFPQGRIRDEIAQTGAKQVATSVIVTCELRFGARKKNSAKLTQNVEAVLTVLPILPLEQTVDAVYADIRVKLESAGQIIGPNDLLIAAHALALGLILVTDKVAAFRQVPGLVVENWLNGASKLAD
jgi:tRNA(fMet)-specific endonuclease VapC